MRIKGKDWKVWRLRQDKAVRPKASTGLSLLRFLRLTLAGGEATQMRVRLLFQRVEVRPLHGTTLRCTDLHGMTDV